ncbi:unnamed protein product, partial [marine sediment metagenome]
LAYDTVDLVASYSRMGAARVAISLVTQTVTGAYASGGFVEIDAVNMPGSYRLDLPDACFVAGVPEVAVQLKGAAGMAPVNLGIPIDVSLGTDNKSLISIDVQPNINLQPAAGDANITFQSQLDALSVASSAVNAAPSDDNVDGAIVDGITFAGNQVSGTYASVAALDNVYHSTTDNAGDLDLVYKYPVGGDGLPSSVTFNFIFQGNNDSILVKVWNGSTWRQAGTLVGTAASTTQEEGFTLFVDEKEDGFAYIWFDGDGALSSSNL